MACMSITIEALKDSYQVFLFERKNSNNIKSSLCESIENFNEWISVNELFANTLSPK